MNVAHQFRCTPTLLHRVWSVPGHASVRTIRNSCFQFQRSQTNNYFCALAVLNKWKTVLLVPPKNFMKTVGFGQQQRFTSVKASARSKMQLTMNEVNRNVSENILVFSQENDAFYKFLSFFGVFQMLLWGYLSLSPVQDLRTIPVRKYNEGGEQSMAMPWWKRWLYKEGQYKNAITGIFLTVGASILFVSLTYPQRAVKSLWLLKGGRHIKVVTHSPFKSSQSFSVPVENVNCLQARTGDATQIPLKIKNKSFFFLMDKQGTFHHPEMFDFVIGLKRNL